MAVRSLDETAVVCLAEWPHDPCRIETHKDSWRKCPTGDFSPLVKVSATPQLGVMRTVLVLARISVTD